MPSSVELTSPSLPSSGIQEIIRMMFEVQNGTVQTRNRPIASSWLLDVEDQKIGDQKADDQREEPGQDREFECRHSTEGTSAPM